MISFTKTDWLHFSTREAPANCTHCYENLIIVGVPLLKILSQRESRWSEFWCKKYFSLFRRRFKRGVLQLFCFKGWNFKSTRPKPAYGLQGLDWMDWPPWLSKIVMWPTGGSNWPSFAQNALRHQQEDPTDLLWLKMLRAQQGDPNDLLCLKNVMSLTGGSNWAPLVKNVTSPTGGSNWPFICLAWRYSKMS